MATIAYGCGCEITTDMFTGMVLGVYFCEEHDHMFSSHKSLVQMAEEIRALHPLKGDLNDLLESE
jgi:hypothetical protein